MGRTTKIRQKIRKELKKDINFCSLKHIHERFVEYFNGSEVFVAESNFSVLKAASLIGFVALHVLIVITDRVIPWFTYSFLDKLMPFCFLPLFALSLYFQTHKKSLKSSRIISTVLGFVFLSLLMIFAIYANTARSGSLNHVQVFVSIVFLLIPSFFIIPVEWITLFIIISETVFLYLSHKNKTDLYFTMDFYSSVSAVICTVAETFLIWKLRFKEFESRRKLEMLSKIDRLTGILNKGSFEEEVKLYLNPKFSNASQPCTLMILDLDDFKSINDNFGHLVGDELLEGFGHKIREIFRSKDYIGRIGGDEFCVLIKNCVDQRIIAKKSEEIKKNIRHILKSSPETEITCSIGIACHTEGTVSFQDLFEKADHALYFAKRNGKDGYSIYAEE